MVGPTMSLSYPPRLVLGTMVYHRVPLRGRAGINIMCVLFRRPQVNPRLVV